ncbi:MAG: hypothetical protein CMJ74_08140 [Planctomycetaceae bacterium]|nr:hypothetical protein [Planctomycetaceae bacterium]|tara:strand:- start:6497 stop:8587 length:2091 start_codon:yes stop_codon:yes gene_type:complete
MHLIFAAWYSIENWPYIAMALAGLGFVIFVHELGHFAVAKMCGVKCEKFYIGFDPPLKIGLGKFSFRLPSALWKKQWGETEYGIGIIPLGGYVKMLGQDDNPSREAEKIRDARQASPEDGSEATDSERENYLTDPRSYVSQTVPERMAIISAGVIMNLIFAWIFATIAFSPGFGVPYIRCDVASVMPGEAAYQAGIQPGDQIVEINGLKKPRFKDLRQEVILGDLENGIPVTVDRNNSEGGVETFQFSLLPRQSDGQLLRIIGVSPASTLQLAEAAVAVPGSPADAVAENLQPGDTIIEVNGEGVSNYVEYRAALAKHNTEPVTITLARFEDESPVEVKVAPRFLRRYGLEMELGPIVAVRPGSPAADAGLQQGDLIEAIDGETPGDPLSLPQRISADDQLNIELEVRRGDTQEKFIVPRRPVPWKSDVLKTMELPSLGIAYETLNTVAGVTPDSPAARAGIMPGDQIVAVDLDPANEEQAAKDRLLFPKGRMVTQNIGEPDGVSWVLWLRSVAQSIQDDTALEVTVLREGQQVKLTVPPATLSETAIPGRGFVFVQETDTMRAGNLTEAMALGWRETKYSMLMVYRFLHKLVSGQVSPQLLGGPGTIAAVAGMSAKQGAASLLLFLTMLSANLAVINFLPIPVLDGGHMVFLFLEGIFRRPVSEKIVIPLTWAGLLLILALMLFVIGLDVNRFML